MVKIKAAKVQISRVLFPSMGEAPKTQHIIKLHHHLKKKGGKKLPYEARHN